MSRRPLARGFSLAEVLLATALFSILSLVVVNLMTSQLRISRMLGLRMQRERAQMLLLERLRLDVQSTVAAGLSPQVDGLAVQPTKEVTPEGTLVFDLEKLAAYRHLPAEKRIERKYWQTRMPLPLTSPATRISGLDWPGLETGVPPSQRERWENVKSFKVSSEPGVTVGMRLWFDLEWIGKNNKTYPQRFPLYTRQVP